MEILGWICLGIAIFWLFLILVAFILQCVMRKRINTKFHQLDMLLSQMYNCLSNLANLIVDNKGNVSSRADDFISKIDKVDLREISKERRNRFLSNEAAIKEELLSVCQENNLLNDPMYITLTNSLNEVEQQYRKTIGFYNADIDAYNYWVKFIPIRLFSKLFKVKLKEKL